MYYGEALTLTIELETEEQQALLKAYQTLLQLNEDLHNFNKENKNKSRAIQFEMEEDNELIKNLEATLENVMEELRG